VITPFVALIEAWLRTDITLRASVIHERLVADHGFTGHYQRVKVHLARVRPIVAGELAGDGQDSGLRGSQGKTRLAEDLPTRQVVPWPTREVVRGHKARHAKTLDFLYASFPTSKD